MKDGSVDYRLEKWVFQNFYMEGVINEAQYKKCIDILIKKHRPPFWDIESLADITDRGSLGKGDRMLMSKHIYCGICGLHYSARYWHPGTYNNIVWQCRSVNKKGCHCHNTHLYDEVLSKAIVYALGDAAKRNSMVKMDCLSVLHKIGKKAADAMFDYDSWTYICQPDVFAITDSVIVMPDRTERVVFSDDNIYEYFVPEYSPKKKGVTL